jgi:hypothetical protein
MKDKWLKIAEIIDAFRIFPRLVLLCYVVGTAYIVNWYIGFHPIPVTECNAALIDILTKNGLPLDQALKLACSPKELIGHPTGYTTLISVIVSAGAGVFGFYTATGRKWAKSD